MVAFWLLLLVDFCAGCNFGSSISNLSSKIIKYYSENIASPFKPDDSFILSLLSVSVLIGSMVGSMSVSYFMDKFGRKKVTIASALAGVILNGLTIIPVHWVYLFIVRIFVGIPSAALTTTIPAWLSELATTK